MNTMPDFADILASIRDASALRRYMARSLGKIVTKLLNENEPLLKAEWDGTEIVVTERGGPLVFTITVVPERAE